MMTRLVALALVLSTTACFPHNARHRRIAKWTEGGAIAGGIALLSVANTGADCTAGPAGRPEYDSCRHDAMLVGDVGLALILGGLVGFGVTQMMSPDETAPPPPKPLAVETADDAASSPGAPTLPKRTAVKPR